MRTPGPLDAANEALARDALRYVTETRALAKQLLTNGVGAQQGLTEDDLTRLGLVRLQELSAQRVAAAAAAQEWAGYSINAVISKVADGETQRAVPTAATA